MQPLDAERVREWRHRRMLSQSELAQRAGTSLFTIQRIERGEGNVRPKTGRGVAAALGVPIEELLPKAQSPLPFDEPQRAEVTHASGTGEGTTVRLVEDERARALVERWGQRIDARVADLEERLDEARGYQAVRTLRDSAVDELLTLHDWLGSDLRALFPERVDEDLCFEIAEVLNREVLSRMVPAVARIAERCVSLAETIDQQREAAANVEDINEKLAKQRVTRKTA